ncbi:hypothetical protein COV25_02035 [candidate division WWE3 bacterium CG10_big_fil_rev_8_21_14_0_10_35_32]|nr:MAG: hypothetical protein COV25_02035 [candidate division WWE3 bacterium CG10_big_fil_rev_8_21_14_0_10_35_32]
MQSNITVAKVNTKGQLVLPSTYRKKLKILPESQVEIRLDSTSMSISPIVGVLSFLSEENSYTSVLRDSQGSWGKEFSTKIKRDLEKTISKRIKDAQW